MQQIKNLYLSDEAFDLACHINNVPSYISKELLKNGYIHIVESLIDVFEKQNIDILGQINCSTIISYLMNEHIYSIMGLNEEQIKEVEKNENYQKRLFSIVIDKYFTIEHFHYSEEVVSDKYYPPLTSAQLYVNYMLHSLKQFKQKHPQETLLVDVIHKGLMMCHCICNLLISGFETEAFSTWRTLHETECIALILYKYGRPVIDSYLKHIRYGLAFRNAIGNKKEQDEIFVEIKEGMKKRNLKSKDMKRYIECGWLYVIDELANHPDFRINFRNGIEFAAGLSDMNSRYEMSSEIAHSSPLLIYSNKEFFFYMSVVCMYESFLRIEEIFNAVMESSADAMDINSYRIVRNSYLPQIKAILEIERSKINKNS